VYVLSRLGLEGFAAGVVGLTMAVSYIGLLTHSTQLAIPAKGWRQKQLQNTCDFFPGSYVAELLFGMQLRQALETQTLMRNLTAHCASCIE
jgi:hypothetical protein